MNVKGEGLKQGITARTEVRYNWRRKDLERTLVVDSLRISVEQDGKEIMNTFMSRNRFSDVQQGRTNEFTADTAPERLKAILQDSFGVPLCILQVDEQGKEVKRNMVAGPGAKGLVDNGMIANALLFHPPFPREGNEWSADSNVSMGNSSYAKGSLNYQKQAGAKSRQACNVSGTLKCDRSKLPDSPVTIRNARYVVTGEQSFDPAVKEWVTGRMTMQVSNQMAVNEKTIGTSEGTIAAAFEMVPAGQ
jgi:hypothetical protein